MGNALTYKISDKQFEYLDFAIILLFAAMPLSASFNYRINIFLTWEGAYRISQGQVPYADFGSPVGFGLFLVPALFFKIFGPQFLSLIKAQVLLNIISGVSFRQILKNFTVQPSVVTLSILVYSLSYTFMNAWPWYNHSVIIFQFAGLALITAAYTNNRSAVPKIIGGSLLLVLSFFTKQDAGALGIMIANFVTLGNALLTRQWKNFLLLILSIAAISTAVVLSLNDSFFYWFNYGQQPHNSRLSVYDIVSEFLMASDWIRFYLFAFIIVVLHEFTVKSKTRTTIELLFALCFLGILAEAAIFQATSYVPENNNIFFHSFAFAFFFWYICSNKALSFQTSAAFCTVCAGVFLLWSANYYKYADRYLSRFRPASRNISSTGENVVDKSNYIKETYREGSIPTSQWKQSTFYTFRKIKMPPSTVAGIERLKRMPQMQDIQNKKILNMSELSSLAHDLGYRLERGSYYPFWNHLGVGMFNKQLYMFQNRIRNNYYDVILYEYLPHLNNFYPLVLHEQLKKEYKMEFRFLAPRDPTNAYIEVYVKK